jgi:hypothetical protein
VVGKFHQAGQAITLAGVTVLRFDADGLVVDTTWITGCRAKGGRRRTPVGARSADFSAPVRTSSTKSVKTISEPNPNPYVGLAAR